MGISISPEKVVAGSFGQRVGQLRVPGDQQQHRHDVVVPLVVVEHSVVLL